MDNISENVVPALELCFLNISMTDLTLQTCDTLTTIRWLAHHGLIANKRICDKCPRPMHLQARRGKKVGDGYCWKCSKCNRVKSVRLGSFFEGAHLNLIQMVEILYLWSLERPQAEASKQTGVSTRSLQDWYNFIREICARYLTDNPGEMGGPDRNVEIDETKFNERTNRRGDYKPGQWVLGMIERETNVTMMVPVDKRDAVTILPVIAKYVRAGTRIVTNRWQDYNALPRQELENYGYTFVAPENSINCVKDCWDLFKTKFNAMKGNKDPNFDSYLQEFLWRCRIKDNFFGNILYWIRYYYGVS